MLGYLNIVLHGHLPYVINHGRWPHGSDWLFEASAETYIPILQFLDELAARDVPVRLSMGITPILMEQLADPLFPDDFRGYLKQKIDAAIVDEKAFTKIGDEKRKALSKMWIKYYRGIEEEFDNIGGNIVKAFRKHYETGRCEITTCGATHGYMPLLGTDESCSAQIQMAKRTFERHIGTTPKGIWLPEAAYRPSYEWTRPAGPENVTFMRKGVEEFLYEAGIKYFFVDSHLLKGGKAIGVYIDRFKALKNLWAQFEKSYTPREENKKYTPYHPYLTSSTGGKNAVGFYTRDPETGLQVWSGEWGYPGNGAYIDFHKKHFPGGHRYWSVTNAKADLADKVLYKPEVIDGILDEQAHHFSSLVHEILERHNKDLKDGDPTPIITAPFDAELFGHWWFEGPRWLARVVENIAKSDKVNMSTGWEYLEQNPPGSVVHLPEGSWGQGGFHYIWLNDWTKWTWEHIYEDEDIMVDFATKFNNNSDHNMERLLNQLGRELLLLESSDWQFLISTFSARDYAENRIAFHHEQFQKITKLINTYKTDGNISDFDWQYMDDIEKQDCPFEDIDFRLWKKIK